MIELDDGLAHWHDLQEQCEWSGILIGNGFSQNIWTRFGYQSLFETASGGDGARLNAQDVALFERLETKNFEVILSALSTSKTVAKALDQDETLLVERESSIRSALIAAVHAVHVSWTSMEDDTLVHLAEGLSTYASIYSTNYDLLVYWSMMNDVSAFKDFFWSEEFDVTNTRVWGKKSKVHFVHGGLHLYRRPNGQTLKRHATEGQNLLDLFATPFRDAVPLFISEGTAEEKLASIYRSDYLSFVFAQLATDDAPMVIFGHSLSANDQHILDAVGSHKGRALAVSLRSDGSIRQRKAAIIKALPYAAISFFDATSHPLGQQHLNMEGPPQ